MKYKTADGFEKPGLLEKRNSSNISANVGECEPDGFSSLQTTIQPFLNPLSPNNDVSQTSHWNIKGVSVLIFEQLLRTTSVRNVWKHKRRICNLTPGLKGLKSDVVTAKQKNLTTI